jgi:hypothetical protein
MPFCPKCHSEYRLGFTRCTDCGLELIESLPEEKPEEFHQAEVELVELATFPNSSEAEMIQELLEDNDISTVLRGDVDPLGLASGAESITLLVEEADLVEAQKLYEDYFAGEGEEEPEQPGGEQDDEADANQP